MGSKVNAAPPPGLPNGGTTGQNLAKTSNTDFAVAWTTPAAPADPDAIDVDFDPTGLTNVTATNVQDAIEELDAASGGGSGLNETLIAADGEPNVVVAVAGTNYLVPVNDTNGVSLEDIFDVSLSGGVDGDVLTYESGSFVLATPDVTPPETHLGYWSPFAGPFTIADTTWDNSAFIDEFLPLEDLVAGMWIGVSMSGRYTSMTDDVYLDVIIQNRSAGAPELLISESGTVVPHYDTVGKGFPGWTGLSGADSVFSGELIHRLTADDINAGDLTVGVIVRSSGATGGVLSDLFFSVKVF